MEEVTKDISNSKNTLFKLRKPFQAISMEWSNKSNLLAVAATRNVYFKNYTGFEIDYSGLGIVQILDAISGRFYSMDFGIKSMACLKWSHDDKVLFAVGDDFIRAWNVLTGKLIYEISGKIASVELSNNGLFLAIALINGPVSILDVYTGRVYYQLNLRANSIKINSGDLIKFNPEATHIAIYSFDEKMVKIFQLDPEKIIGSFLVDQVNEMHSWAFQSPWETPDCFRQEGILSWNRKFCAIIQGPTTLIRNIIKITDLA
jgi:WD40 repeat protein